MTTFTRNWWMLALRGLFAILFGVMSLIWPALSLATLVILFGAYSLADGIIAIVSAVHKRGNVWALALEGVAGIAAALVAFVYPGLTALALLYLIAAWAVVTGVLEIVAAARVRAVIENEVLLAMAGALSIVFGVLLALRPAAGALALVWLIGGYAIVFGIMLIALGFRLHEYEKQHSSKSEVGAQVTV